ncbi:MAG TPA: FIST N-terminal domain-containing protein [Candidatus Competibacteraceae bacterium]|nr:FIST N-terminal domain-containing protein [Candidatus Competibacteraceae bacterium]
MTEQLVHTALADSIVWGMSEEPQARAAIAQLAARIARPDAALSLVFSAGHSDPGELAAALREYLPAATIGCTAAGVIAPEGYPVSGISGVSLGRDRFAAVSACIGDLRRFRIVEGQRIVQSLLRRLSARVGPVTSHNTFALLLIDGLCRNEERVVSSIDVSLGGIGLVGGSAGDSLRFERSFVFHGGVAHPDSAVLALVHSRLPFRAFSTHHFIGTGLRVVVTRADPTRRLVMEINGAPAAEEYARLLHLPVAALDHQVFSTYPLVVRIGSSCHVRAIVCANQDRSLTFGCAIDEGVVLRLAYRGDMLANLSDTFAELTDFIGPPVLTLGFNCAFRQLEMERAGDSAAIAALLRRNRVVGFSTFGEQFNAMHLNQTFTGVAFGSAPP